MTMDLFTFDPTTGEEKDPDDLNDLDRATYDACKGALEILERLDTDSDTISRQAAIDALRGYLVGKRCPDDGTLTCRLIENEVTNKLPPAQLGTNLAEVGTDCISRQALLDKFEPWLKVKDYNDGELNMLKAVLYEIRFMRPAQPELKKGKWVLVCDNNGMHFICNKCGAWRYHQEQKFCGECGADMREVTT